MLAEQEGTASHITKCGKGISNVLLPFLKHSTSVTGQGGILGFRDDWFFPVCIYVHWVSLRWAAHKEKDNLDFPKHKGFDQLGSLSRQTHIKHTPLTSPRATPLLSPSEHRIKPVTKKSYSLLPGSGEVCVLFPRTRLLSETRGRAHTILSQCWAPANEILQHSPLCAPTIGVHRAAGHLHTPTPRSTNWPCLTSDAAEVILPHIPPELESLSCSQIILPSFASKPSAVIDLRF